MRQPFVGCRCKLEWREGSRCRVLTRRRKESPETNKPARLGGAGRIFIPSINYKAVAALNARRSHCEGNNRYAVIVHEHQENSSTTAEMNESTQDGSRRQARPPRKLISRSIETRYHRPVCRHSILWVILLSGVLLQTHAPVLGQQDDRSLERRIASLESSIQAIESSASEWDTWQRETVIQKLVLEALVDAEQRTSLQSSGIMGWDGLPYLASIENAFRLNLEARIQWRHVLSRRNDSSIEDEDRTLAGFEARRVRLIFSGHVVDPSIRYRVQATHSRSGGWLQLEDGYVQKDIVDGLDLTIGQFRPAFSREQDVSTFRTTAVERSLAHGAIEIGRSQGIQVGYQGERLHWRAALHDGDGFANSSSLESDTDLALAGRIEWLVTDGSWRGFADFTGWPDEEQRMAVLLGAGVNWQRGEFGDASNVRADDWRWTLDATVKSPGWHAFAAYGQRKVDPDHGEETSVSILTIQAGVFVTPADELFLRYEWGSDRIPGHDELSLITLGLSHYFRKHKLKVQWDLGYGFNGVSDTFASSGAGWRADSADENGQVVIRSQIQMTF